MSESPKVSLSINFIHKGDPTSLLRAVDSAYGALYREGDECIVVDTGSKCSELVRLREGLQPFPNCKLIERPDLSIEYKEKILEWLGPQELQKFQEGMGSTSGVRSFAEAREVAREASSNEVVFWMDSDDVLVEEDPGKLREIVDMVFAGEGKGKMQALMLDYQYNFGPDGQCTTLLRRERFVPRDKYHWVGRCHEVLVPQPGVEVQNVGFFADLKSFIVHTEARKPHQMSDIRNYVLLRTDLEESVAKTGTCDPRTLYYLGNSARGLFRFPEALEVYREFDRNSGSKDDRYSAKFYSAGIYLDPRYLRPWSAVDTYFDCLLIKPNDPRAYFGLQRAFYVLARYEESMKYYELGLRHSMPGTQVMSYDPTYNDYHPHILAAFTAKEVGDMEAAVNFVQRGLQKRPDFEEAKEILRVFQNLHLGQQLTQAIHIFQQNSSLSVRECLDLLSSVPPDLEKAGLGKFEPPEGREKKPEIVFYCGKGWEEWSYENRKEGIGGSERMVIMLSEALQRTGKVNVSVYADVPVDCRGIHADTGVAWWHFSQFDTSRPRDVLVVWRGIENLANLKVPAKTRVAWLHDVQDPARWTEQLLAHVDLVQFQSEFHTQPVKEVIPSDKIWVARNAIEPPKDHGLKRRPKQVLYCSSPDRGLLTAIRIVEAAQKIDPEIELVMTYGFSPWVRKMFAQQSHRYCPDVGHVIAMDVYEREIFQALDRVGGVNLGRIGFEQMERAMQTAGVWLYPTRFPEISCMSAMEAQANGLVCLATRYGALATTLLPEVNNTATHLPSLPSGIEITDDQIEAMALQLVEATRVAADEQHRTIQSSRAIEQFNVDDLAQDWLDKLGLSGSTPSGDRGDLKTPVALEAESDPLLPEGVIVAEEPGDPKSREQNLIFGCDMEKAKEILGALPKNE